MSATGKRRQSGFTIIECLAVLAITALAGTLAFPSLERALQAARITQSTQALVADLRQARGAALSAGLPEVLVIGADARSYRWNGGVTRALPSDEQLQVNAGQRIAFFADGSASPGQLEVTAGQRRSSICVSETGAISLTRMRQSGRSQ